MIVSSSHNLVFISRPGRPPKRMTPITTFANMPNPDPTFLGAMSNNFQGGIPSPPPQQQHPRDLPPGFNPFLHSLGGSSGVSAQMAQHAQVVTSIMFTLISHIHWSQAQAALLSRNGLLPGAANSAATHEAMMEKYGHMLRQLQG